MIKPAPAKNGKDAGSGLDKGQTPSNQRQMERENQEGRGSGEGLSGIQPGAGHPHGR